MASGIAVRRAEAGWTCYLGVESLIQTSAPLSTRHLNMLRHSLLCCQRVPTLKPLSAFSISPPACFHRRQSTAAPISSIKARNISMAATGNERKFGSGDPHTQSADDTQASRGRQPDVASRPPTSTRLPHSCI